VTWQLHKKMQHRRDHRSTTWWDWDKTNQTSVELKKIKHEQMRINRTGVLGPDSSQGRDEPKKKSPKSPDSSIKTKHLE